MPRDIYTLEHENIGKLKEPAEDIRYLLQRGYPRRASVQLAGNRYGLDKNERHILERTVFSKETAETRRRKKINCDELEGRTVLVDGYNVIITLENILKNEMIWIADDSFLRDTRGIFKKHANDEFTFRAAEEILVFVKVSNVKNTTILLDSQMKNSGELASFIRRKMKNMSVTGDARTSRHTDHDLKNAGKDIIIATADGIIIDAAETVIDMPACIYRTWNEPYFPDDIEQ